MTPEEAKELRDKATPGPWDLNLRERDGIRPEIDLHIGNRLALSADYKLADAAPALAELVAGLRYVYAVQVIEDGRTWYINSYKTLTSGSRSAEWLPTFESADALRRKCVTELCLQERCAETFIVRMLTSELEVIDPGVVS